ncbi:MAG: hypothetical protein ACK5Q5_15125 [Planctomycetaceae bacterium]
MSRLWRREGLKVPQKKRKRRCLGCSESLGCSENGYSLPKAKHNDHVWCWDFVFDPVTNGSMLKCLSIVDEFTRECLVLRAGAASQKV